MAVVGLSLRKRLDSKYLALRQDLAGIFEVGITDIVIESNTDRMSRRKRVENSEMPDGVTVDRLVECDSAFPAKRPVQQRTHTSTMGLRNANRSLKAGVICDVVENDNRQTNAEHQQ